MKLEDIVKTEQEIKDMRHSIKNNIIKSVGVNVVAHFGNVTCFEIACKHVYVMSSYNNLRNLGYIIKAFVELFDISEEGGIGLSNIKNVPCRLIFEGSGGLGSKCIGFGHFMEDKFVLTEDFVKVDE